jgi:hypothetical protein
MIRFQMNLPLISQPENPIMDIQKFDHITSLHVRTSQVNFFYIFPGKTVLCLHPMLAELPDHSILPGDELDDFRKLAVGLLSIIYTHQIDAEPQ